MKKYDSGQKIYDVKIYVKDANHPNHEFVLDFVVIASDFSECFEKITEYMSKFDDEYTIAFIKEDYPNKIPL